MQLGLSSMSAKLTQISFQDPAAAPREFQNLCFLVLNAIWWFKPSSLRSWLETGENLVGNVIKLI